MVNEVRVDDAETVDPLLKPIDRPVVSATADCAYDKRKVYQVLEPRTGRILIPPRSNAKIWKHGNSAGPPLARDEKLRGHPTGGPPGVEAGGRLPCAVTGQDEHVSDEDDLRQRAGQPEAGVPGDRGGNPLPSIDHHDPPRDTGK